MHVQVKVKTAQQVTMQLDLLSLNKAPIKKHLKLLKYFKLS